jgi:hypothetical protein
MQPNPSIHRTIKKLRFFRPVISNVSRMQTDSPSQLVRSRYFFLAGALIALAIGALVLALFKGSSTFPTASVFSVAAIAFVWGNFVFWWLELRSPHIEANGAYSSRYDLASKSARVQSNLFFGAFSVGAVLVTLACINVAVSG